MKWEITEGSSFPVLKFNLDKGEVIKSQSGSMMAMSEGLELKGKVDGGIGKSFSRMFSGEDFFLQNIIAQNREGWITLAPEMPGGIASIDITPDREITVQKDGFLAGTNEIEVSTKVQGLIKGILGKEGFFVVKIGGSGTVFLQTYGAVYNIDIAKGEEVIIDNGYLMAWDSSLQYKISKAAKSWFSAFTTGSGFVCKFTGPGRVWVQTRNPEIFATWMQSYLPKPSSGRGGSSMTGSSLLSGFSSKNN